jgi:alpha-glucosidase
MKFSSHQLRLISTLVLSAGLSAWAYAQSEALISPDQRLAIVFETVKNNHPAADGGQLVYSITLDGKPLIIRSHLGLEFEGEPLLGADVKLLEGERASFEQAYDLLAGKISHVEERYHSLQLQFKETVSPARRLNIEARAYDDAVAFRYQVPTQSGFSDFRLTHELTEFRISKDAMTYALVLPDFLSSYESEHIKIPLTSFSHTGSFVNDATIGLPLLMELPGVTWLAITEADMEGYSSLYLTNLSQNWAGTWLQGKLAPQVEDPEVLVTGHLPLQSPWRVVQVGAHPGRLMESNILSNLNPASAIADTSWIKPGKAAWNWWSRNIGADGKSEFSTATMNHYVDFAHESGLEYMLIDAGWAAKGDITRLNGRVDVPEVVRYAAAKNVGIWIWIHYRDAVRQMDEAFALYEAWGVKGLKIDFVERDDQAGLEFYYRAARKAAEHRLLLDFHGSTKPSGLSRTYPNILGYEAVIGMEVSLGGLRDNPDNSLMLPFTRMLGGFMDYTPGGFNNVTRSEFIPRREKPMVMGTRAHHLAMYVVFESPIQMVSDYPGAYANEPAFQFIKDVPATWDELRVIDGAPGEYVTLARRSGAEWFLGSMTNWTPREITVPLDFLSSGTYVAEIYRDAPDSGAFPKHTITERFSVTRDQPLRIALATGGGCAIRFQPINLNP